jgi:hypothetical protein
MNNYWGWKINQHPAPMLYKMEEQILNWDIFISKFTYSKRWKEYLSNKVYVISNFNNFDFSKFTENQKKKILKYKNCWILGERIIPMWDWKKILNPFIKKENEKQKLKKLLILRDAYSWSEKQKEILEEIEKIEKRLEMTIEEYLNI